VVYCQNLNVVLPNPVDHSVVAENNLPDVVNTKLRNHPPQAGIMCQAIRSSECPIGEHRRHLRDVSCNEHADRIEIVESLRRPPYLSHFAIR